MSVPVCVSVLLCDAAARALACAVVFVQVAVVVFSSGLQVTGTPLRLPH